MIILFQQKLPQKFSTTCYFRVGSLNINCRVIIRYLFAAKVTGLSSREGSPVGLLEAVGVFRCYFAAISLLFLCSLAALLYGNSTGIVRGGLQLDFYNLLIDLFVFLAGGDAHVNPRKIGMQASRHVGTGRDKLYHLRTRFSFSRRGRLRTRT